MLVYEFMHVGSHVCLRKSVHIYSAMTGQDDADINGKTDQGMRGKGAGNYKGQVA